MNISADTGTIDAIRAENAEIERSLQTQISEMQQLTAMQAQLGAGAPGQALAMQGNRMPGSAVDALTTQGNRMPGSAVDALATQGNRMPGSAVDALATQGNRMPDGRGAPVNLPGSVPKKLEDLEESLLKSDAFKRKMMTVMRAAGHMAHGGVSLRGLAHAGHALGMESLGRALPELQMAIQLGEVLGNMVGERIYHGERTRLEAQELTEQGHLIDAGQKAGIDVQNRQLADRMAANEANRKVDDLHRILTISDVAARAMHPMDAFDDFKEERLAEKQANEARLISDMAKAVKNPESAGYSRRQAIAAVGHANAKETEVSAAIQKFVLDHVKSAEEKMKRHAAMEAEHKRDLAKIEDENPSFRSIEKQKLTHFREMEKLEMHHKQSWNSF